MNKITNTYNLYSMRNNEKKIEDEIMEWRDENDGIEGSIKMVKK